MSDKLPIAPTTETLKSLIRANLFINHAKQHALSENEFDTMISIHNLDNAIEYTLRILIRHLQIQERTGRTINSCELAQLIGEIQRFIKDEYNESLSFVQELKMIRDLRNLAQHAMIVPTSEVSTYLSYATSFFERTLEKFFGISTEKLKYSSVIRCNEVKELLNEAENCIDRCKFLEAIVNCRDAFDYANFLYNNDSIQRITRAPAFSELRMKNNKLYQYLLDLDRRVSLDILKTDISQYLHYMEYINCIPFEYQANWVGNTVLMRDWEIKDAEFCYLFVSQSIMQWERNCREPIQESCVSEEHQVEFVDEICEVSATAVFPSYGCQYLFENEEARLFYCDKTGFDRLKNCLKKNVVTITEKKLKGSCIQTHTLHYANVVHFDIQLVMNSPATWEVVLVYYAVPFTLKDMLDSSKNFFIDDCNRNELMKIGFDSEKADLFIRKRKEIGQIDSIEKACKLYNEVRDTLTKIKKNLTSSTLLGILEKDISR